MVSETWRDNPDVTNAIQSGAHRMRVLRYAMNSGLARILDVKPTEHWSPLELRTCLMSAARGASAEDNELQRYRDHVVDSGAFESSLQKCRRGDIGNSGS